MSDASVRSEAGAKVAGGAAFGLLATFGATLFLSAFLLFAVQPLFAKLVLPRLGGAPAVWSIAMVFFQAALLAGYAYADAIVRYAGRLGVVIHAALMALALLWLPVAIAPGFEFAAGVEPAFLGAGAFRRLARRPVPCRRRQRSAASGLVLADGARARARSLLPLWGEQHRKSDRASLVIRSSSSRFSR